MTTIMKNGNTQKTQKTYEQGTLAKNPALRHYDTDGDSDYPGHHFVHEPLTYTHKKKKKLPRNEIAFFFLYVTNQIIRVLLLNS